MIKIDPFFIELYIECHEKWFSDIYSRFSLTAEKKGLNQPERAFLADIHANALKLIKMDRKEMLAFVVEVNRNHPLVYSLGKIKDITRDSRGRPSERALTQKHSDINSILAGCGLSQIRKSSLPSMRKDAIQIIKSKFHTKRVFDRIKRLFNYDLFRNENGATFVTKSQIEACPYCNRAFITCYKKDSLTTADIDHFFPRSLYPFFGISLYNLIPCCSFCNERLKLAKDFTKEEHLYPYENGFMDNVKFVIEPNRDDVLHFDDINAFSIRIRCDDSNTAAVSSIRTFHIEDLYQSHRQIVTRIARIKRLNTKERRDELQRLCGIPEAEINTYLNNLYLLSGEDGILSKFSKDISDDIDKKFGIT